MATEDCSRSRRIFKTTSPGNTHDEDSMEVDAVSRKGKGKEKSGKGKKGGKKGKESHSGTGYGETTTGHWRFEGVENAESTDTKLLIVGTSSCPNLKAKARAGSSRWKTARNVGTR